MSQQFGIHSAMPSFDSVLHATSVALKGSPDLHTLLATFTVDPWAADVRATLEERWAQLDLLSGDSCEYVDRQHRTLHIFMEARLPALAVYIGT